MSESFSDHLDRASATVATWPKWKRNLLGNSRKMNKESDMETQDKQGKTPWQAVGEKYTSRQGWSSNWVYAPIWRPIYEDCIDEYLRRLPLGDEGLAKLHQDALAASGNGWVPWDNCTPKTTIDSTKAMGAVTAELRRRGWLNEYEAKELREEHARAECTITPDDAEAMAEEVYDAGHEIGAIYTTPWHELEGRQRRTLIDAMRCVLEQRVGKTKHEPVTPEKLWADEINAIGYEDLPDWVRNAAFVEAARRNEKGGE